MFEVYPWAAMLRQGLAPGPALGVLDGCRIRTGVVEAVDGEWVSVTAPQLAWDGAALLDSRHTLAEHAGPSMAKPSWQSRWWEKRLPSTGTGCATLSGPIRSIGSTASSINNVEPSDSTAYRSASRRQHD